MRHRTQTRKLGMKTAHRQAVLRNLVTSLIEHGRVSTTLPKAKEAKRLTDKMVTLAKNGTVHARRQALAFIKSKEAVNKLFGEIVKTFADKNGGYCRVLQTGFRQGDGAAMSILELAGDSLEKKKTVAPPKMVKKQSVPVKPVVADEAQETPISASDEQSN